MRCKVARARNPVKTWRLALTWGAPAANLARPRIGAKFPFDRRIGRPAHGMNRPFAAPRHPRTWVAAALCAFGVAFLWAPAASAQTGKISGNVVDKKTGRALAFVNIAVPEAKT